MTDQELLELVQTTAPHDLTQEQVQLIQQRLSESVELQQIFRSRLKLQSYLIEMSSRCEPNSRAAAAEEARPLPSKFKRLFVLTGALLCGALLVAAAVGLFRGQSAHVTPSEAEATPDAAATPPTQAATRPPKSASDRASPNRSQEPINLADSEAAASAVSAAPQPATTSQTQGVPPWQPALAADAVPRRFDQTCFEQFDTATALPRSTDLEQWFGPVAGAEGEFMEVPHQHGSCGAIQGLFRLKSPWSEDSALRVGLAASDRLQIHFFRGQRGVSLSNRAGAWWAHVNSRLPGASTPDSWAITASDGGRSASYGLAARRPLELRYRSGQLILSQGDLILLRAPLDGPPEQVFFQGRAVFYGLALLRTRGVPPERSILATEKQLDRPLEQMDWVRNTSSAARVESLGDGTLRLEAQGSRSVEWLQTARPACQAIVLELAAVTPGVGIQLVDAEGNSLASWRYVLSPTGRLRLSLQNGGTAASAAAVSPSGATGGTVGARCPPLDCVSERHWLRLLFGVSSIRWWLSADGHHWAEVAEPLPLSPAWATHLRLSLAASRGRSGVSLRRVLLQRFSRQGPGGDERAPPSVLAVDVPDYGAWIEEVIRTCPADIDTQIWKRACALRTLARGCAADLGYALLELLGADAADSMTLRQQLELLIELATLLDGSLDRRILRTLETRIHQLAWSAFERDSMRPFSFVRRAQLMAQTAPPAAWKVEDQELIRAELLQLVYGKQWAAVLEFCRMLQFFGWHERAPLFEWAVATAVRSAAGQPAAGLVVRQKASWRDMLLIQEDRRTFSDAAALDVLITSGSYQQAGNTITSIPLEFRGLAPWLTDAQLLVPFATAVQLRMQDEPASEQIAEQFQSAAALLVQQAIAANDLPALRLATRQFDGSSAACAAHAWLGDHALSQGDFATAEFHYERAKSDAVVRTKLKEKSDLAAAAGLGTAVDTPRPADYLVQARIALPVPRRGTSAQFERSTVPATADLPPRLAVAVDGDAVFVGNRFQVTAVDATLGHSSWTSPLLSQELGPSADWWTPMQPAVTTGRIFVRLLSDRGPVVACLDRQTGENLWVTPDRAEVLVVSDPFLMAHQLYCLSMARGDQGQWLLSLTELDPETGTVWGQRPLLALREHWQDRRACHVRTRADLLYVSLGGVTLCCDVAGTIIWLRRHLVVPVDADPRPTAEHFEPLLVRGNSVFLAPAGVRALARLDADTGRLRWQRVMPHIRNIVGARQDVAAVQTEGNLIGLDANTGRTRWRHQVEALLAVLPWSGAERILVVDRIRSDGRWTPRLVWLDPRTGEVGRTTRLSSLKDAEVCLCPRVVRGERIWACFQREAEEGVLLSPLNQ